MKLMPGVRLNFSKSGVSVSVGPRGAKVTAGPRGTRATVGIPGTGMSYTEKLDRPREESQDDGSAQRTARSSISLGWIVAAILAVALAFALLT
jgi:hypothetical protein